MKKIFYVILILICFCLVGCDNTQPDPDVEAEHEYITEFKKFEQAKSFHTSIYFESSFSDVSTKELKYIIKENEKAYQYTVYIDSGLVDYVYNKDTKMLYYNGIYEKGQYYGNFLSSNEVSLTAYMQNIEITDKISADLDLKGYLENVDDNYLGKIIDGMEIAHSTCEIMLIDNLISEYIISFTVEGVTFNLIQVVHEYNTEINIDPISFDFTYYSNYIDFTDMLDRDIDKIQKYGANQETGYQFILTNDVIYVAQGDTLPKISGKLYYLGELKRNFIDVDGIEGYYDLNIPGTYNVNVLVEFKDIWIKADLQIVVCEHTEKVVKDVVDESFNDVVYSFGFSNYYVLCSENKVTFIDLDTKEIVKTLDIPYEVVSHYVKNDYLYLGSYTKGNINGLITMINFQTFEIEKQVECGLMPNSLFVDKRGNVVTITAYQLYGHPVIIDMDTGTRKTALKGYISIFETIYYEEDDCFVAIGSAGYNTIYTYNEEVGLYEKASVISGLQCDYVVAETDGAYLSDGFIVSFTNDACKTLIIKEKDSYFVEAGYLNDNVCVTIGSDKDYIYITELVFNDVLIHEYKLKLQNSVIQSAYCYNQSTYFFDSYSGNLYILVEEK